MVQVISYMNVLSRRGVGEEEDEDERPVIILKALHYCITAGKFADNARY